VAHKLRPLIAACGKDYKCDTGHPRCGDSMVSAVMDENGAYADPDYEWPGLAGNE